MKRIFLNFLLIFFFLFWGLFSSAATFAVIALENLIITPKNVNFGNPVSIVLTNIPQPNQGQDIYEVQVFKSDLYRTGQGLKAGARILVNYRNNKTTCSDQKTTGPWLASECTGSTTGPFTFAASLDTGKLEVDPGFQNTEYTAVVSLSSSETPGKTAQQQTLEKTFIVVQSIQSNAAFSIDSITPPNPGPGETVQINLSQIAKFGIYTPGARTPDVNQRAECNSSTCTLALRLPLLTTPEIRIVVRDPDGNIKEATLPIDTNKPFPTATLPPPPPPPPCTKWEGNKCIAVGTAIGEISTNPIGFVKSIFGVILSLSGGIALLLIILSGYKLMFSQGNPEKAQEAKETLTAAIVGLLFIIFSLAILQVIGVDILKIPGFGK
ncbi:MAG: hypothetical protein HYS68_02675 [Candidatus Levybacteria bacterium]|nr:hypothetical protein [Candidatus Levybacteria bacterium]